MHSKYTTIAKLILNASKKVNDRRAVATNEVAWSRGVANGAGHSRRSEIIVVAARTAPMFPNPPELLRLEPYSDGLRNPTRVSFAFQ
jgi:hypothetical protein